MKVMRMNPIRTLALVAAAGVVAAGCAVVPGYDASPSTFEGFPVVSFVPDHAAGIVFAFHGTGGSADFATKLETVDMLNHLTAHGYGFVSTESTDRTSKQWDTASLSLTDNPDLARLSRLYASLVSSGRITGAGSIGLFISFSSSESGRSRRRFSISWRNSSSSDWRAISSKLLRNSFAMLRALPTHWPTMRSRRGISFGPTTTRATTRKIRIWLQLRSNIRLGWD